MGVVTAIRGEDYEVSAKAMTGYNSITGCVSDVSLAHRDIKLSASKYISYCALLIKCSVWM